MLRQIVPLFFTMDIPGTLAYYKEKLGFECLGTWQEPPVYAIVSRGGVCIHFGRTDSATVHTNESIRRGSMEAWVRVTGIQALYEEFISRGVEVPYPPTERIYDRTEIEITDCDGHKLVFGE